MPKIPYDQYPCPKYSHPVDFRYYDVSLRNSCLKMVRSSKMRSIPSDMRRNLFVLKMVKRSHREQHIIKAYEAKGIITHRLPQLTQWLDEPIIFAVQDNHKSTTPLPYDDDETSFVFAKEVTELFKDEEEDIHSKTPIGLSASFNAALAKLGLFLPRKRATTATDAQPRQKRSTAH